MVAPSSSGPGQCSPGTRSRGQGFPGHRIEQAIQRTSPMTSASSGQGKHECSGVVACHHPAAVLPLRPLYQEAILGPDDIDVARPLTPLRAVHEDRTSLGQRWLHRVTHDVNHHALRRIDSAVR